MRILVDTNICLDILQKRPEFYDNSIQKIFVQEFVSARMCKDV